MEAMRQSWSDDRLDALNDRVGELSRRVDAGFARAEVRAEAGLARLDAKIDAVAVELRQEVKAGFDQSESRFDRMQQTIIVVGGGLIGVMIATGGGLIATQL